MINIGSGLPRSGFSQLSLYCSSKAALEGLTRCWATELAGAEHTVNMVNPGPMLTAQTVDKVPQHLVIKQ